MKVYYFSEFPYHEYDDEESLKYESLRVVFPIATSTPIRPTACSSGTSKRRSTVRRWGSTA